MAITPRGAKIFTGDEKLFQAPALMSAVAAGTYDYFRGSGWIRASATLGTLYGGRLAFTGTKDFSGHPLLTFQIFTRTWDLRQYMDTVANGGMRILFYDGSGNYAGWKLYGNDIPDYDPNAYSARSDLMLGAWVESVDWVIDRARTADYSSGTLNWAAVAGVELHLKTAGSGTYADVDMCLYQLGVMNTPVYTGGSIGTPCVLTQMSDAAESNGYTQTYGNKFHCPRIPYQYYGLSSPAIMPKIGFDIGDGSTATVFIDSANIGFWNTWETSPTYRCVGPYVQLNNSRQRMITINQSSSDVVRMTDSNISSAKYWGLEIKGNTAGEASFTRTNFYRSNSFIAKHGRFYSCVWDGCDYVEINASTILTGGVIRNAGSGMDGLRLVAAPGNYSAITATLSGNTTRDLTISPASAGTFDLSGLSVPAGYTLKIHNLSTTLAITVTLAAGITYSTTTAGGTVTVSSPQTTLTINNIIDGSRILIRRTDNQAVLVNAVVSGTSYAYSYGGSGIPVEIVIRKATGSPTYQQWYTTATLAATSAAITAGQQLDE